MRRDTNTSNPAGIIRHLRRLEPPSVIDLNNPSEEARAAISFLGALAESYLKPWPYHREATFQVQEMWTEVLDRWVVFFLTKVIMSTDEVKTVEGISLMEKTLNVIAELLLTDAEGIGRIKHLEALVVPIFFKVIDMNHSSWTKWTSVVRMVIEPVPLKLPIVNPPVHSGYSDTERSMILIRHLESLIPQLPRMTRRELNHFSAFLSLFKSKLDFPDAIEENPYSAPRTFECLAIAIRMLACKRKTFIKSPENNPSERIIHMLVSMCAEVLSTVMRTPLQAERLLMHGIIEAILNTPAIVLSADAEITSERARPVVPSLVRILDHIAIFLVDHHVLRAFVRGLAKCITPDKFEERLKVSCRPLWDAWTRTKTKALGFYNLRQDIKERKGFCGYGQVTLDRIP
ncbi:hypothetical protein PQX77_009400 [Marasmius sp. AFHP31]|nr:hypothetical protein PQX77_009400 [Marasmius sp. AFHP31]